MKQKNKELLRALFDLQPANTNLLANHLNVSVRSIKNYVREINEEISRSYSFIKGRIPSGYGISEIHTG